MIAADARVEGRPSSPAPFAANCSTTEQVARRALPCYETAGARGCGPEGQRYAGAGSWGMPVCMLTSVG